MALRGGERGNLSRKERTSTVKSSSAPRRMLLFECWEIYSAEKNIIFFKIYGEEKKYDREICVYNCSDNFNYVDTFIL